MHPPDDYKLAELIMSQGLTYFAVAIVSLIEKLCMFLFVKYLL